MKAQRIARAVASFIVVPILVGLVVVVVLADTSWGNERVRRVIVSQANDRMAGRLSIGALHGNLFSHARLSDVSLVDSTKRPVFTARGVEVHYALFPLLRGHVVIESAVLDTAEATLEKRPGERWNFQSLMKPRAPSSGTKSAPPSLSNITLRHSRFYYRRPWVPDSTLGTRARDSVIAKALAADARRRVERVPNGFQRVLDYHDIDAVLPSVRIGDSVSPTSVDIGKLAMLAEPYRPPVIDVRNLAGVLYVSKDSLWWRGAHMKMPSSNVSGDGTIGFHKAGFRLDLRGAPIALADLRWLDPRLPRRGGGAVHYAMQIRQDTASFAISEADLHLDSASVKGAADVALVTKAPGKRRIVVHDADLTIERLSTALLREIDPSLPFKRAGTFDGHIVANGGAHATDVDADVSFLDAAAGRSRVVAKGGIALDDGGAARELNVRLEPLRLVSVAEFARKAKLSGVMNGAVIVNGSPRDGFSARGDLTHSDNTGTSQLSGSGRYQAAGQRFVADVTLHPLALATAGRYAPSAELRGSVSGKLHAQGTPKDFSVSGQLHSRSGGTLDVNGAATMARDATRYDFLVQVDSFDAKAISRRAPLTSLSGTITAKGSGTTLATANGVVLANLVKSRYDTFAVDHLHLDASLSDGLATIRKSDVEAWGITANVDGTLGLVASRSGKLAFSTVIDSLQALRRWLGSTDTGVVVPASLRQARVVQAARADSAKRAEERRIEQLALGLPPGVEMHVDSIPGIRRDSIAGWLTAYGWVTGNIVSPGVEAILRGKGLVARGYSVRALDASAKSANVRDRKSLVTFAIVADTLQAMGRAFDQLRASGTAAGKDISTSLFVRQDSMVQYAALGRLGIGDNHDYDIRLDSLRATFDTLVWRLAHPAHLAVAKDDYVVDSLDLRSSAGGRLFANGFVRSMVQLDLAADQVDVATALRAMQVDARAAGLVSFSAYVEGLRATTALTGRAALRSARFNDLRAPDVDADFSYRDLVAGVTASARDSSGRIVLHGTGSAPLDLALKGIDASRLLPGPLVGDVTLDSLSLAALPLSTRALEEFHGMIAGNAHVRGSWKLPLYTGRLALRDGGLTMPSSTTGMRVDRALADIRITGDSVILDSLVAFAKGRMTASGALDFTNRARPTVSFVASGTELRVFDSPRGLVDANAEIRGAGPLDEIRVTGRGEMLRGYLALKQFRKDLLRVKPPGEVSFFPVFDTSAAPNDSLRVALERARHRKFAVIADLSIVVDRGNYYRNRPDANTEFYTGDGEVLAAHIDQRTSDQWIGGFARIGDGGIAIFRTRGFVPVRGALTFGTHTDAAGLVQQVGERTVWEAGRGLLPLQMLTGGTSVGPAVGLESGSLFPIRGRELNGYLTMGRTSLSLLQQSGSSLSGSEEWSGQLSGETGALAHRQQGATAIGVVLHDIGTGATKEFLLDAFSVSPSDVPTELVFGKTGGVRGALAEGGRYITPDLYIAGQLHLFTSGLPGVRMSRKFGTTYRLDAGFEPRFLFRNPADLGITHPTERTSAFGAFLTRMWSY